MAEMKATWKVIVPPDQQKITIIQYVILKCGGGDATAVEPSLAPTVARRAALIPYWVCELERRLFTSSSFALWASGRLNALLRIDSDTLLIGMYAKLSPDSC